MKHVTIYTDGACEGNPGPGGFAAIIEEEEEEEGETRDVTGGEPHTTNNRMELKAVIAGLAALDETSRVRVVTDSQYVAKGMTSWIHGWRRRGWKTASGSPVKNRELWEELDTLAKRHRVQWEWVRGHDGHPGNERADTLAKEAVPR